MDGVLESKLLRELREVVGVRIDIVAGLRLARTSMGSN
jgi:hypothetical protein